jgi:hypothetical protein
VKAPEYAFWRLLFRPRDSSGEIRREAMDWLRAISVLGGTLLLLALLDH